jgi:hypothetical protein
MTQFSIEEKRIISFFQRNEKYFRDLISLSYPLTEGLLERYKSFLNWRKISSNQVLQWTEPFIEKYINELDWCNLTENTKLPWSLNFLEKYKTRLWGKYYGDIFCQGWLSSNEALPWSEELIEKYKDKWDWESLSTVNNIPWSVTLIERYKNKWDWECLSFNSEILKDIEICSKFHFFVFLKSDDNAGWQYALWTIDDIEKNKDTLSWMHLSASSHLNWTMEILIKYKDYWYWGDPDNRNCSCGLELFRNEDLPWSIELIELFENKWYYESLVYNDGVNNYLLPKLSPKLVETLLQLVA